MNAGTQRRAWICRDLALRVLERHRVRPDLGSWTDVPEPRESALLAGETGILLVAFRLTSGPDLAETLHTRVRENVHNEADEIMWGAPGTLIAARLMLGWTQEPRWRAAWDESADAVLARRDSDGQWTQRLHGHATRYLGPVHGLVGNVQALAPLLDAKRRSALLRRTAAILGRAAIVEDGLANWPPEEGERLGEHAWRDPVAVVPRSAGDPLLGCLLSRRIASCLPARNSTWVAGAHRDAKGASICHGTAGNGYALLKAFARTGDELWLERARKFAVHALAQMRRERSARGRGRYSLFTGDLGVALYLADCLERTNRVPGASTPLDSRP